MIASLSSCLAMSIGSAARTPGMPAETHLSITAMILGGVFDKVPDSLRICFTHGGGSFAFWLGRFENAWHKRGDLSATSQQPPRRN